MPKARLIFDVDWVYTEKEARIHKLTQETEDKIDNIPGVVDDVNSTSTTDALSANMGKYLQDQINNISWTTIFLSTWDCTTGLPETDPAVDPYTYKTWNYYIVWKVASSGWTNYRPHWATYTHWVPSTSVETQEINVNDWYIYDWQAWVIQPASTVAIVIDDMLKPNSTNAVENRAIYSAVSQKQDKILDLAEIRAWAMAWANWLQPWDNITELVNNAGYQTAWDVAVAIETLAPHWVWEWILTLQKNSSTIDTFSANASQDKTINIPVPTTVAELSDVNDYATKDYVDWNVIHRWATAPDNPTEGMLWYDTTNDQLKVYDGTNWNVTWKEYVAWDWISINWTTISNTWVLSSNNTYNNVIYLSQADYEALQDKDPNTLYCTPEGTWISVVDDTAYSSSWNWVTTLAPSKNAVYDKLNTMDTNISWKQPTLVSWTNIKTINWASILWSWDLIVSTWNMAYSDFNFQSKAWTSITLDLASTITPSANFTVNAPAEIKDWQTYILRVNSWATAYTMTLGTNVTNPYDADITLTANWLDQFVFLAVWWKLELQFDINTILWDIETLLANI